MQPLVAGTGTTGQITKWTDGASGTLGDSVITELLSGKVGVGTVNPLSKLHVSSNFDALRMTSTNDTTPTWAQFNTTAGSGLGYFGVEGSTAGTFLTGTLPYATAISSGSSGTALQLGSAGSVKMTILSNGSVGIGTPSPAAKIDVNGTVGVYGSGLSGDILQRFVLYSDTTNGLLFEAPVVDGMKMDYHFNWRGGGLDALTIKANGNVGIGTTSPGDTLTVNGNSTLGKAQSSGSTTTAVAYDEGSGFVGFQKRGTSQSGLMGLGNNASEVVSSSGNLGLLTYNPGYLSLGTNNTERMRVDASGNVGIGTTNPNFGKPHVQGGATAYAVYASGTGPATVWAQNFSGGDGVDGISVTSRGVLGNSSTGPGVVGESVSGTGVVAFSITGNLVDGFNGSNVRKFHIDLNGTYTAGSDFAEALPASGNRASYEPGDVLVVSTKAPGKVEKASRPYDVRVAGIYSTRPGMLGADKNGTSRVDKDDVPVAIVGIVPTKVSAENGPIQVGDLLTTSRTPGYAMKASPIFMRGVKVYRTGTILGKALEPLKQAKGVIKVLVMLR